jgi:hypothetical protein
MEAHGADLAVPPCIQEVGVVPCFWLCALADLAMPPCIQDASVIPFSIRCGADLAMCP